MTSVNFVKILTITGMTLLFWIGSRRYESSDSNEIKPDSQSTALTQKRTVALSPSLVEIVYQLECEASLVGVSRFCNYPPDAKNKPVVGGYLDLNLEKVIRLKPDVVLLLREQESQVEHLQRLGIETHFFDHTSTEAILSSILKIGTILHKRTKAERIVATIEKRMDQLSPLSGSIDQKPRVLISIDRNTEEAQPSALIAAGAGGVHQEYIELAGAINAYNGPASYPSLSRENLIRLNPDFIIELVQKDHWRSVGEKKLRKQWETYPELKAVQNGRVFFLHEDRHHIPGPRFIETLETISHILQSNHSS